MIGTYLFSFTLYLHVVYNFDSKINIYETASTKFEQNLENTLHGRLFFSKPFYLIKYFILKMVAHESF